MAEDNKSFDWLDIVAMTVATFQILAPMLLGLVGAVFGIYLLLWIMAR